MVNRTDWQHDESFSYGSIPKGVPGEKRRRPVIRGNVAIVSRLGNVKITYRENFSFTLGDEDSFEAVAVGVNSGWKIEGLRVVNSEGQPSEIHEIEDILPAEFSWVNYDDIKDAIFRHDPAEPSDLVDIECGAHESPDPLDSRCMEAYVVPVDGKPDLRFQGHLVARVASQPKRLSKHGSDDDAGRWSELTLYMTSSGKYVCAQVGRTLWEGEHDRHAACACDDVSQVIQFFGHRWLAKSLYHLAGIDDSVVI